MYIGTGELHNFLNIIYTFDNTEFLRLADDMLSSDRKEFGYTGVRKLDNETLKMIVFGARANILREPLETMPDARRKIAK